MRFQLAAVVFAVSPVALAHGEAPRGASTVIIREGKVTEIRDGLVPPEAGASSKTSIS